MPNPVSVNFSIYLLPWPPDQTFGDCEISHELPLPLEQLYVGKEQESGAAGRNLVLALPSSRNITQGWKVAHTDACFVHREPVLGTGHTKQVLWDPSTPRARVPWGIPAPHVPAAL